MTHNVVLVNVSKKFKNNTVLNDINLSLQSGRIYGFVGENGCGKTVLMKIIIGLMRTSTGYVAYDEKMLKKDYDFLPSVGFIIETPGFFKELSGLDNLKIIAGINKKIGQDTIETWMKRLNLPVDDKQVGEYSLGMRQRLGIIQALMENPDVIVLDEVTNALDEDTVNMVYELLYEEKKKGKLIIISSHSKNDIDTLCDEVYRLKEGRLFYENTKA